jgi:hypothetical protein
VIEATEDNTGLKRELGYTITDFLEKLVYLF